MAEVPSSRLPFFAPQGPIPELAEPDDPESPASPPEDGTEDGDVYADQDDAQSFIQPAMSEVATRLTSPRTPAAEMAAAMDKLPGGGIFDAPDEQGPLSPLAVSGHAPLPTAELPAPWQAGPRRFTMDSRLPSISSVFQSRTYRSSSAGENALKRLSKALPSILIPSGFIPNIPNIPTASFLSSLGAPFQKDGPSSHSDQAPVTATQCSRPPAGPTPATDLPAQPGSRSHALRKSTSDDSLLYQSLSRVSSFGDEERFAHVRGQVNSRFKAIKDSCDGPSFKIPQFPSINCAFPWLGVRCADLSQISSVFHKRSCSQSLHLVHAGTSLLPEVSGYLETKCLP